MSGFCWYSASQLPMLISCLRSSSSWMGQLGEQRLALVAEAGVFLGQSAISMVSSTSNSRQAAHVSPLGTDAKSLRVIATKGIRSISRASLRLGRFAGATRPSSALEGARKSKTGAKWIPAALGPQYRTRMQHPARMFLGLITATLNLVSTKRFSEVRADK